MRYHEGALKCIVVEGVEFKGAVQADKQDDTVLKRKAIPSISAEGGQ